MGRHHRRCLADDCDIDDEINKVCETCERPELFCACPDEYKRELEGWDTA
jgi:hypothetical protein